MRKAIFGPPGTGKTTRIISLINEIVESGQNPDRMCALTFSRNAAKNLSDRLFHKIGFVGTIHSFGYLYTQSGENTAMLQDEFRRMFNRFGLALTDTNDISTKGDEYLHILENYGGIIPDGYNFRIGYYGDYEQFYKQFVDYKRRYRYFDFHDLLQLATKREYKQYDCVILDESQDLTEDQWALFSKICQHAHTVIIAGDDDQSIYEFMGANSRVMNRFINDHKLETEVLSQSYRIPKQVHDVAEDIIRRVTSRVDKKYNAKDETGRVTITDMSVRSLKNIKPNSVLLCRNRAHLNIIKAELLDFGIVPCEIGKKDNLGFYDWFIAARAWRNSDFVKRQSIRLVQSLITYEAQHNPTATWDHAIRVPQKQKSKLNKLRSLYTDDEIFDCKIPTVEIGTIHSAKGLEFDNVVVVDSISGVTSKHIIDTYDSECRVFYVGVTRAAKTLQIIESIHPFITPMITDKYKYLA